MMGPFHEALYKSNKSKDGRKNKQSEEAPELFIIIKYSLGQIMAMARLLKLFRILHFR